MCPEKALSNKGQHQNLLDCGPQRDREKWASRWGGEESSERSQDQPMEKAPSVPPRQPSSQKHLSTTAITMEERKQKVATPLEKVTWVHAHQWHGSKNSSQIISDSHHWNVPLPHVYTYLAMHMPLPTQQTSVQNQDKTNGWLCSLPRNQGGHPPLSICMPALQLSEAPDDPDSRQMCKEPPVPTHGPKRNGTPTLLCSCYIMLPNAPNQPTDTQPHITTSHHYASEHVRDSLKRHTERTNRKSSGWGSWQSPDHHPA